MQQRPLRPSELAHFHSVLGERYGELARAVERLEHAVEQPESRSDDPVIELQDHDYDILEAQDRALIDVARALQRLSDGTYGRCESCGVWIAPERLEILPETSVCRDCQSDGAHVFARALRERRDDERRRDVLRERYLRA
jgi:RNA polymerase-binding transcription factor DksA